MPKGVPKTEGEKIGDKFDKAYRKMKGKSKDKKSERGTCKKEGCSCGKKK